MAQLASPSLTGSIPTVVEQQRSRLRRHGRTVLWLCLTTIVIAAVVAVVVLLAPHVLHAIHPGPTGGGV